MLRNLFISTADMSIKGVYVILIVMAVRLLLKRFPKKYSYALWSVVLFRLLCPVSLETKFSLVPKETDRVLTHLYNSSSGIPIAGNMDGNFNDFVGASNISSDILSVLAFIWIVGVAVLLIKNSLELKKLSKMLTDAENIKDNIYVSDKIETAFVLGALKNKIYLPKSIGEDERNYILLHEQTHIERFDPFIKLIAFLTLCLHWFNPFVWAAFFLSAEDMEMSCDEKVIEEMGVNIKKDYSSLLLSLAFGRKSVRGVPLSFGGGNTSKRIKNVLHYKKPALWLLTLLTALVAVAALLLLTDKKPKEEPAIWGVDAIIEKMDMENRTILANVISDRIELYPEVLVSYDEKTSFHYVKGGEVPDVVGLTPFDFNEGDEIVLFLDEISYGEDAEINTAYAVTIQASGELLKKLSK